MHKRAKMDAEIKFEGREKHDIAHDIYKANIDLIKSCDAIMANMEAFRGPGMDGGTAFEIGFAVALGLPVVGYGAGGETYLQKCERLGITTDGLVDQAGLQIEDFDLVDNLMMTCGVTQMQSTAQDAAQYLSQLFSKD